MIFSLVIPCFNEAKNIPLVLESCNFIKTLDKIELILVDNGSTDDTQEVFTKLLPNYPFCKSVRVENNIGYGNGILAGLAVANGEILGWTHADMQTDPKDILKGLKLFEKNSKKFFIKGRRVERPFGDNIFTFGMSVFESILLLKPMYDINAQPTMFSRSLYNNWKNPPSDFSLDLYAYYSALKQGYIVRRFQVKFGDRAHGLSNWNINWKSKLKFIVRTIKYSIKLKKQL